MYQTEFYFIRHGQTSWGKEDILKGPQDLSLNDIGVEQALNAGIIIKDLSKKFSKEAVIITSNLKRAFETAQRISKLTNITIIDQKNGLKERYYGDYRLITKDFNTSPPDAETTEYFEKRVMKSLLEILTKYKGKTLIIVSHQKVFEYISYVLSGHKQRLSQGGIAHFMPKGNIWELKILYSEI